MTQAQSKLSAVFKDPAGFAQFVAERILALGLADEAEIDGPLKLLVDDQTMLLENLWRGVKDGDTKSFDDVDAYLLDIFAENPLERAPFEFIESCIMPRIMSRALFESDPDHPETFVHTKFPNDTVVVYVVEQKGHLVPVKVGHAQKWGVDAVRIHQAAQANLDVASNNFTLGLMDVPSETRGFTIQEPDGFSAERILLPNLHDRFSGKFSGKFYVAVANRGRMAVVSAENPDMVSKLLTAMRNDFIRQPNPVSDRFFSTGPKGVAPALIS